AQAALVTLWNAAMALGGVVGGLLLDHWGTGAVAASAAVLGAAALLVVVGGRRDAFPGT
ncbi:MFS transporter, partial [Streptomyces sp. SID9727]|nr:MFS transporter [Streptomyces sp. SID9727]